MGETSELVPVMAATGNGAIHVLDPDASVNQDWMPGLEGKTMCGRTSLWYFSGLVMDGDRPCKQCDKKAAVAIAMFEAEARVMHGAELHMQYTFEQWLYFGRRHGFLSEPVCYIHDGIPLTDEEMDEMDETGEPDHCIFVVRIDYP